MLCRMKARKQQESLLRNPWVEYLDEVHHKLTISQITSDHNRLQDEGTRTAGEPTPKPVSLELYMKHSSTIFLLHLLHKLWTKQ